MCPSTEATMLVTRNGRSGCARSQGAIAAQTSSAVAGAPGGNRTSNCTARHGTVAGMYTSGPRALQDRFDTRRLADRLESHLGQDGLLPRKDFIESLPFFFLATADADGRPQCSYKGGDP